MAVVGRPLCKIVVKLVDLAFTQTVTEQGRAKATYLERLLVVLDVVSIYVVMGANWFSQLGPNHHPRSLGRWPAREEHDSSSGILERRLQEPNSNTQSDSAASQTAAITCNWPRVFLKLLKSFRKLKVALFNRQQKARCGSCHHRTSRLLRRHTGTQGGREQA